MNGRFAGWLLLGALLLAAANAEACRPFGSYAFVEDAEGGVWFTEGDNNAVSRLAPDGTVTAYPLPTAAAEPADLALDGAGNLWFVEMYGGKLGRLAPDGRITEYPLAGHHPHPWRIWVDGEQGVWFLEGNDPARVGRLDPDGAIRNYIIERGWPTAMAPAADGGVWLTVLEPAVEEGGMDQAAGRIVHLGRDGTRRELLRRAGSCPMNITPDPAGRLWFSDRCRQGIERLDPDGTLTRFPLPAESFVQQMALDEEGVLWFIDNTRNLIGRLDAEGTLREYPLPGDTGGPFAMALSRAGGVLFSETYNYNINRLSPAGVFTEQLVNVDARRGVERVERGEVCYLRFASIIRRKAEVDAERAAALASGKLAAAESEGARLLRERCLACHDAKRILLARKSDWRPSLGLMDTYMGIRHVVPLTEAERTTLLEYLDTHYRIGR
ncbi:virginiamycin B lyase family protein [Thioalbus denitrificans]|uniref:Streptogramin lyase n=1 Tax=Thioalbus denitrificans TaxID=547122 RepID=A0A369BZX0_9GAMM|nr:hypothetical protein [Thioalbus denitrificans]RCX26328.1 streptogramin lyase [Thioalbus denitrificans]